MTDALTSLPSALVYLALFALGIGRGLLYYASGAAATYRAPDDGRVAQAQDKVRRLGARSVLVTYPAYGLAGATQVANGAARIPLGRFLLFLSIASACWAALQTLVGVAVWQALLG